MRISISTTVAVAVQWLFVTGALAASPPKPTTQNRAEIGAQYRWDFSPIYSSWEAWETAMQEIQAKMGTFSSHKGTLKNGAVAVLNTYRALDEIGSMRDKVYWYPRLQRDINTRDQVASGKSQRVGAVFAKFDTDSAWFTPELLQIPQATMELWIRDTPALAPYKFAILDKYRQHLHVLDEAGEKLLSLAGRLNQTPRATYQDLSTADIKFPKVTLSDGKEQTLSLGKYQVVLQQNYNQADRAKAYEAYIGAYAANANTYAAIYNGVMQKNWFMAQARKFPNTLDATLERNAVPPSVVRNLVETVRAGTAPLQRYAKLRKKLLGLDTYHLYDRAIPIYRTTATYPYDDAKAIVLRSVAPLGSDYTEKYRKLLATQQIDAYESEAKRSGAYVASVYGVGPYMLLNHNDTQDALFTLAHEGGHAMHTVLSYENQPYVTSDYTIFVAEVASTINERFLLNELLQTTSDPKERFLQLQNAAGAILATFYTQVLLADFELQAHKLVEQGKPVTAAVLNGIYLNLLRTYYGDSMTVDDANKANWLPIQHLFNSPYYVYQYATCFASSAKLFKDMTSGEPAARAAATERYLELLRSGGNDYPMAQLQKAGVDLSKPETVQAVVDQFDELVTQMEIEAAKL